MQKSYIVISSFLLAFIVFLDSCAHLPTAHDEINRQNHGQIVVVTGKRDSIRAKLELFENSASGRQLVFGPVPAVVGKNGIADMGQKREGDGKTPQGLFNIESAFGYADEIATRLNYFKATSLDKWIDDVASPNYNQWIRGQTRAKSFENLKRSDDLYKYAFVIGYNREPVIRGHGSAIFAHVWKNAESGTAGCVAIEEDQMKKLLSLLDKSKKPIISIKAE